MKRLSSALALIAPMTLLSCGAAHGEVFKCLLPQGQVGFASGPCPDGSIGIPLHQAGPPRMLRDGEPPDHAHKVNLKATEYLKVSGRAPVIVTETDSYKQFQKNRPPPPSVASHCQSPRYDSQCFDPSGGQSSIRPRH